MSRCRDPQLEVVVNFDLYFSILKVKSVIVGGDDFLACRLYILTQSHSVAMCIPILRDEVYAYITTLEYVDWIIMRVLSGYLRQNINSSSFVQKKHVNMVKGKSVVDN